MRLKENNGKLVIQEAVVKQININLLGYSYYVESYVDYTSAHFCTPAQCIDIPYPDSIDQEDYKAKEQFCQEKLKEISEKLVDEFNKFEEHLKKTLEGME